MPGGRPTVYSPEMAARICEGLSEGKSLRTVCREEGMPSLSSVFLWIGKYPEFSEQYARAKSECADALVEDIHRQVFSPHIDLSQVDLNSLDGSNASGSTASEHFRELFQTPEPRT